MKRANVDRLACPACRKNYAVRVVSQSGDRVETAFLTCPRCCITIPVLRGIPVFESQFLAEPRDAHEMERRLLGEPQQYLAFLEKKREKPVYDLYAAFQPFNESTQCIFPLFPLLREVLQPGDLILDLWCRTGWSGEMLAANFPEQQVISVWESTGGLLGIKGFDYWLGGGGRRENLDIVIHSPNDPLPFADGMFAVVHGLDTLHRYHHVPLIAECLRVNRASGIIVFPHNHLTNSQPDPYFDRGEDQMHGKEYEEYFRRLLRDSNRRAFVLSEKTLFDAGAEYRLVDEADTSHYNGLILIADRKHEGRVFPRQGKAVNAHGGAFVVVNPLWRIDLTKGEAVPFPQAMDSGGDELFFRHPIYHARMLKFSPVSLDETDCLILYWAQRLKTVAEIGGILDVDASGIFERIARLEAQELVQVQNVSPAMAKLQSYYCRQEVPCAGPEATLLALWSRTVHLHREQPFVVWPRDESVFSYGDADTIVRMAAAFLKDQGVESGDRILIDSISHPEFVFLFWGGVCLGAVVAVMNPEMKPDSFRSVLAKTKPKVMFLDRDARRGVFERLPRGAFGYGLSEDSEFFAGSFSERLAEYEPLAEFPSCEEQQEAVVLFTSGSTGAPKGVVLSHGALFRSSRIIDREYGWRSADRFLGGGSFHTMSGLRNPCIAVLHSGASVIIPGAENTQNPLTVMGAALKHRASVLNVTPAFLAYWNVAAQKAKYYESHNLRMVLSTGAALQGAHRDHFEKLFRVPVFDYYGLTETSGACILETPDLHNLEERGIGKPCGSIVRIRDGELCIYTDNLLLGYLKAPEAGPAEGTGVRIENGWLRTGDTARINDSGCIVLVGRKDRMMIDRNGENVYPEEIERAICSAGGAADAFVTQIQDEKGIDHILAVVQFAGDSAPAEEKVARLRTSLKAILPSQHIPSMIFPVTKIPRGASGKVPAETVHELVTAARDRMV